MRKKTHFPWQFISMCGCVVLNSLFMIFGPEDQKPSAALCGVLCLATAVYFWHVDYGHE